MSVYCQTTHPSEDEVGQKTVRTLVNSLVCLGGSSCFLARVPESPPSLAAMPRVLKAGCWLLENKRATYLLGGLTLLDQVCSIFFFFKVRFLLFIYLWLCWVFVSVWGLSLVVASGGHSSSRCVGLSLSRPLLLRSTGSRHAGSVIVAHGPSCSAACGIFPDQGLNPCPLHCQADSQPLRHQGSPGV